IVTRITKEALSKLDPSAKLGADLKLDSLARVELLSALEDRYRIDIDEASFTEATTFADIEKIVHEGRPEDPAPYPYPRWQQRWPLSWLRIGLLYLIVFPAIRMLGWPRIRGQENLRQLRGRVVFVCNHVTMV